jgi:hypothetical protein
MNDDDDGENEKDEDNGNGNAYGNGDWNRGGGMGGYLPANYSLGPSDWGFTL